MDFEPKNFETQKIINLFLTLFWKEYKELWTEHEYMFFNLWIAPNGKNKQNKHYVEEPYTISPDSNTNQI